MRISRTDVIWSYAATFLRIGSYAILLPFILRKMHPEMVGIWSVFMAITAFSALLDMGFGPSFVRNVTYIFSGVKTLKVIGFEPSALDVDSIDYGLLKGVIVAMQWFYLRMAIILFFLLSTLGTYYIFSLLKNYKSDQTEVYLAWCGLCIISTYNIYTQYFDSLLQGKGLVKKSKQILIVGQSVYLFIAALLILYGYGLLAIISAQAFSVIIVRWLSYYTFFTREIKQQLHIASPRPKEEVLKVVYPNALKIGLTSLGAYLIQRSSIVVGSLFLSLDQIAAYGISIQFITIIASFASIYTATYIPKIVQLRVTQNNSSISELYLRGQIILLVTYIAGGLFLLIFGEQALGLIGSKTHMMTTALILAALIISFLESNHGIAGSILLTNNEVPFFKASLTAGVFTILLLIIFFYYSKYGLWAMVLAPGIAQVYNNWKWPYELIKQLHISKRDVVRSLKSPIKFRRNEQ
jgi:O-antigen/teichoic acid export membrane protein